MNRERKRDLSERERELKRETQASKDAIEDNSD